MRVSQLLENEEKLVDVAKRFKENLSICVKKKLYFLQGADYVDFAHDPDTELNWKLYTKREKPRQSRSGNSILMTWTKSEAWEGFPDRKFASFGTQNKEHAEEFGTPNLIIPADSVSVFGYTEHDFNMYSGAVPSVHGDVSHREGTITIDHMISDIRVNLSGLLNLRPETKYRKALSAEFKKQKIAVGNVIDTPEKLLKFCAALDEISKNHSKLKTLVDKDDSADTSVSTQLDRRFTIADTYTNKKGLVHFYTSLTPEQHNVRLIHNLDQLKQAEFKKDELWFVGDFLMFKWEGFLTMTKLLTNLVKKL